MSHFSNKELELFGTMRVCILSPMIQIEPRWVKSVVDMVAFSWNQGLRVEEMGLAERAVVHWARNDLAKAALERESPFGGKYTHFLWLDTDHVFNGDLACQLARHFQLMEVDAVSALYFARTESYLPVAYVKDTLPSDYTHYPLIEVPNCLCEVDAVGFGAIITKREMFENLPYPWFTFPGAGEDIAFCVHAKKAGMRIFLDGQYKLGHLGDRQIITEKVYRKYLAENPDKFGDRIKVRLGGTIENGNLV